MQGIIGVHHHCVSCIIGILPDERKTKQNIYIDIKVKADFAPCLTQENIHDTVNYVTLAETCTLLAQKKSYLLLEALAYDIINEILSNFPVEWVWVRIKKPAAIPSAEYAMVELEQNKKPAPIQHSALPEWQYSKKE